MKISITFLDYHATEINEPPEMQPEIITPLLITYFAFRKWNMALMLMISGLEEKKTYIDKVYKICSFILQHQQSYIAK